MIRYTFEVEWGNAVRATASSFPTLKLIDQLNEALNL
jgi:hypothetical protein